MLNHRFSYLLPQMESYNIGMFIAENAFILSKEKQEGISIVWTFPQMVNTLPVQDMISMSMYLMKRQRKKNFL